MTRTELKNLARQRLKDAEALYHTGNYDGCFYLCGYVVELALKARICKVLNLNEYPEKGFRGAFKTHDFGELKVLAGLDRFLIPSVALSDLYQNWITVLKWRPETRYSPVGTATQQKALDLLEAVRSKPNGVFTWLKKRW